MNDINMFTIFLGALYVEIRYYSKHQHKYLSLIDWVKDRTDNIVVAMIPAVILITGLKDLWSYLGYEQLYNPAISGIIGFLGIHIFDKSYDLLNTIFNYFKQKYTNNETKNSITKPTVTDNNTEL